MKTTSMIDSLIENITTDRALLQESEETISKAKEEKRAIVERLRVLKNDVHVLFKYLDDNQKAKLDELNLDLEVSSGQSLNTVAENAFDILLKAKDNKLTNLQWYETYVKSLKTDEIAVNYSAFNIKCRSLFNSQKVLRNKTVDSKSSKDDIISLNGKPLNKLEVDLTFKKPNNDKK